MQRPLCELYQPPDATRNRPSCAAAELLKELQHVLQDYAPTWYRAEHDAALQSAIEKMDRMGECHTP